MWELYSKVVVGHSAICCYTLCLKKFTFFIYVDYYLSREITDAFNDSGTEETNFYHHIVIAKRLTLEFYVMELKK